jgi:glycolate oxidase iron-sulfur subunit
VADSTVSSESRAPGPQPFDLDRCIHCGLCLNACPTYRQLGLEADSPRGRIFQMIQVANGAPITASYREHLDLCLACRGCESACPSGVPYGRMIEQARVQLDERAGRGWLARRLRHLLLVRIIESRTWLSVAGTLLYLYEVSGLRAIARGLAQLRLFGRFGDLQQLTPSADPPFFFSQIGRTFPAEGEKKLRVAFMAGCIANVSFARLNDATVRVLQRNGCEVVVPNGQGCCGALALHAGLRDDAKRLARSNIDAVLDGGYDAIVSNAAGCGVMLKEYGELLAGDPAYAEKAARFSALTRDATELLCTLDLNRDFGRLDAVVTYQDSCHLAHGQRIRNAPRDLIAAIPGVMLRELPGADVCCGSAGTYNVVQTAMSMQILKAKMESVNLTHAEIIATANPGCILQLQAGVRMYGNGQRVLHVVELLDQAYRQPR